MINLIADKSSERLLYILEVIFKTVLKTPYTFIDLSVSRELNYGSGEVVLNYSSQNIPGSFRLPVAGILFEEGINDYQPAINKDTFPKLFPDVKKDFDLDFDVFSASFYLVTEYEKYGKQVFDKHGRYKEDEYYCFKNNLFKDPLVNIYAEELWDKLAAKYSQLQRRLSKFDYEITIDVDHPWAFLHKGFRTYAGFLKDILKLDGNNLSTRYQSLKTGQDPYYCFEWLYKICPEQKTRFFFLVNNQSKFDGKHDADNPQYDELIRKTAEKGFALGLHPSYNTFISATAIRVEKNMLSGILGKDVITSRQHYLRYHLPQTNRALIEAGIREDYTTAMINGIGFRNGIANEFNWFDLEKNEKTGLILHPTMAMDVSLKNYLGYDAEYAFNMLLDLIEKTKKVGGKFVLLWHNSNLSQIDGWGDWKGLFSELLKYLDSKTK
jgi:hypothetical protein